MNSVDPPLHQGHARRWLGLCVICAATFISGVDTTIVNVALPAIADDLGATFSDLQWVIDGFLVILAGTLLIGSGLADRFGRKRIFVISLLAFALTSMLAVLATNPTQLILARVLMGAAAAGLLPTALSLLAVMFAPSERAKAVGIWTAVAGIGVGFGPLIGSILLELSGWQAVFLINVPVCLAAAVFAIAILPESRRPGVPPLDLLGAAASIVALGGIVFALIEGGSHGFGQMSVLVALGLGIAATAAFVALELRRQFPLFDVRILGRAPVFSGAVALMACYLSFFGSLLLLPQLLYFVQDRSTLVTGLALCPMGVTLGVLAPLSSHLLARIGPRATLVIGVCVMMLGTGVQLLNTADSSIVIVLAGVVIYGAGLAVTITPATAMIMNEVGVAKAGDGGALNQVSRQIGGALGVALVGSTFAVVYRAGFGDDLSGLDSTARSAITKGIEATQQTAAGLAPEIKATLLRDANHSFELAARAGLGVCIGILILSALVTLVALRPRPLRGSSGAVVDSPG